MTKYYKKNKKLTKEDIIGLGESSFKKNYYPELQEKIHELEKSNSRVKGVIEAIPDIILFYDSEDFIDEYNHRDDLEIVEAILSKTAIKNNLLKACASVKKNRKSQSYNFQTSIHNEKRYFESRIYFTSHLEVFIILRDITKEKRIEESLRKKAITDSLTGLKNRRYFEEILENYQGTRFNHLTLILFDIDGLKIINDTLGHSFGDDVIVKVAHLIKRFFYGTITVARISGDEFAVLTVAENRYMLENTLFEFQRYLERINASEEVIKFSVSNGYSMIRNNQIINTDEMYQEADNNMFQNKLLKESSVHSGMVKTLMKALEARDYITEGHADRMGDHMIQMGMLLGLSQSSINQLKLLANFHDIGKVGIPDNILNKPGPLNESEWKIMRGHCRIGKKIADESKDLKEIGDLILKHHENYDGSGYPFGLAGEKIPIECRILSIVDAFDAMTNDRPYRKGMPVHEAKQELKRCAGTQFDPNLIDIFINKILLP